MIDRKALDFRDELSEDEVLDTDLDSDDGRPVSLERFLREEGPIYESIEAELPDEDEIVTYDDMLDDELNDALGG